MTDQTSTTTALALQDYGKRDTIKELGDRLRKMMPSAQAFTEAEALSVAQVAISHGLDPFTGEVWGLKGNDGQWRGVMVGIKGYRKAARKTLNGDDTYWLSFLVISPSEMSETRAGVAVRCELRDSRTLRQWTERMSDIQKRLNVSYDVAREVVGPAPIWVGFGFAHPDEKSKMPIYERAQKRAEASALKLRFDISFDFGETVGEEAEYEAVGDEVVEGIAEDVKPEKPKQTPAEIVDQLGFPEEIVK